MGGHKHAGFWSTPSSAGGGGDSSPREGRPLPRVPSKSELGLCSCRPEPAVTGFPTVV